MGGFNKEFYHTKIKILTEINKNQKHQINVLQVNSNSYNKDLTENQKIIESYLAPIEDSITNFKKNISNIGEPIEFIVNVFRFKNDLEYQKSIMKEFKNKIDQCVSYLYSFDLIGGFNRDHFIKYQEYKDYLKTLSNNQKCMSAAINKITRKFINGKISYEGFINAYVHLYIGSTVAKTKTNPGIIPRVISHLTGNNTLYSNEPAGGTSLRLAEWYERDVKITLQPMNSIENTLLTNCEEKKKRLEPCMLGKIVE